jgi:hypothetical protein
MDFSKPQPHGGWPRPRARGRHHPDREPGVGREGPRWEVEEMTEPRLLVIRR